MKWKETAPTTPTPQSKRPAAMPTILVIDDDSVTLQLIQIVLRREGYTIVTAINGAEGLRKAEYLSPDLIILDIMMPGMDGFQVCHHLRKSRETAAVPIIMFSALDRPADQRHAFEAGGTDYLTKPVKKDELLNKVRAALFF